MATHTTSHVPQFSRLILILLAAAVHSRSQDIVSEGTKPSITSTRFKPQKGRLAYFDSELFEAIASEETEKNVVISPMTVKLLLTIMMEGADGPAREEIRRALRLPQSPSVYREIVRSWMAPSMPDSKVKLQVSAGIFVGSDNNVTEEYTAVLREYYASNITKIDVTKKDNATETINNWASNATNGLIPTLIDNDQINPDTVALLASALYFKGGWKDPFTEISTNCFYATSGQCIDAVFMDKSDFFPYAYARQLDADVLELPYAEDQYSMVLMVPRSGDVTDLIRDLPHEPMHRILETLSPSYVNVSLPKFTAKYARDLRHIFTKLRIKEIFSSTMNFKGIEAKGNTTFGIGSVFHATKVIVNEEGSEASGAAGFEVRPNMQSDNEDIVFKVNKPFIFFIRDSTTKTTLFAGVIYEPERASIINNHIKETVLSPNKIITSTTKATIMPNGYTTPPSIYRPTTHKADVKQAHKRS